MFPSVASAIIVHTAELLGDEAYMADDNVTARDIGSGSGKPILWLVVPCYNEEAVLLKTAPMFQAKLDQLVEKGAVSAQSRICYVDDGSKDGTWRIISTLAEDDTRFVGVKLSRNRGHQNALLCGLMEARGRCDAAVSIDCDGQDDINAIDQMVDNFLAGDDIVYGVRADRSSDTAFKRGTAQAFYKVMGAMGADTVYNHADYRLMSARALDELSDYHEVNLFLRGMVPLVGFPSSVVYYERAERIAGESSYSLGKMLGLAVNGITSMSIKPIRIVSGLGVLFSLLGLVGIVWAIVAVVTGQAVAGWASTVVLVSLIGGIQLLSLGVIGEYVGKVYLESKSRPRFAVEQRTWVPAERHYKG